MSSTVISHSLSPRRAFHSTLSTKVALDSLDSDCYLFALYSLPQSIIIDRYELADRRLSFEFWGQSNLELPVFALDQTAKSLLLVNVTPTAHLKQLVVDIPVHARYGEPGMAHAPSRAITIPSPACFRACLPSAQLSSVPSPEPPVANSTILGSLAHFSIPSVSPHYAVLHVPVASKGDTFPVEVGTTTVILVAFLWLVYRCWRVANALQSSHPKEQ